MPPRACFELEISYDVTYMIDVLNLTVEFLPLWPARSRRAAPSGVWARPGMRLTFRAELMPGRDATARTFRVSRVLPSGRVLVEGITGEHAAAEFESR